MLRETFIIWEGAISGNKNSCKCYTVVDITKYLKRKYIYTYIYIYIYITIAVWNNLNIKFQIHNIISSIISFQTFEQ